MGGVQRAQCASALDGCVTGVRGTRHGVAAASPAWRRSHDGAPVSNAREVVGAAAGAAVVQQALHAVECVAQHGCMHAVTCGLRRAVGPLVPRQHTGKQLTSVWPISCDVASVTTDGSPPARFSEKTQAGW